MTFKQVVDSLYCIIPIGLIVWAVFGYLNQRNAARYSDGWQPSILDDLAKGDAGCLKAILGAIIIAIIILLVIVIPAIK